MFDPFHSVFGFHFLYGGAAVPLSTATPKPQQKETSVNIERILADLAKSSISLDTFISRLHEGEQIASHEIEAVSQIIKVLHNDLKVAAYGVSGTTPPPPPAAPASEASAAT
jgi:hypothetical protein